MLTGKQFQSGAIEEVMLRYMTAKHIIQQWYTHDKLTALIHEINTGKNFAETYNNTK